MLRELCKECLSALIEEKNLQREAAQVKEHLSVNMYKAGRANYSASAGRSAAIAGESGAQLAARETEEARENGKQINGLR